jgi:pantetheine-phosphate adenylyltransferase
MTTTAIYPGSFDPPTLGHLSIVRRAAALWDEVVVLIADNPAKDGRFPAEKRREMFAEIVDGHDNVSVEVTDDLVVAFAEQCRDDTRQAILVRGIRNDEDLDYELTLAHTNRQLGHGLETVFLPADPSLEEISSTAVRQKLEAGEPVDALLHPRTAARLTA